MAVSSDSTNASAVSGPASERSWSIAASMSSAATARRLTWTALGSGVGLGSGSQQGEVGGVDVGPER